MRKIVFISLLFAFLFQSLSSLVIIAAFQMNRDYISENLCINRFDAIPLCKGTCYLEQQLSKNEQQQDQPDLKSKESLLFFEQKETEANQPFITGFAAIISIPYEPALSKGALSAVFKPPVPAV